MSKELKTILMRCKLEQHYEYLSTKGFNSWQSLQLLDQSDFEQLQAIPYGHFKLILQTIQKYSKEQNISASDKKIRPKYKQFLKSLNKIPKPDNIFSNIDKQINKYQEMKQQYLTNWTIHQQYHSKISNFLKTTSQSEIDAPVTTEELREFLTSMQKLNGSLQQLLQNMGNTNYDINGGTDTNINNDEIKIDTDSNIKPSNAKHSKKRSNSNSTKKKKLATPSNWMVDEESSLIQDVQLYAKINMMKIKDLNNYDWKSIAIAHNDNFWKNTEFKGRSYKDCKVRYKKAPITGIDTSPNHINGEIDEPSGSDDDDKNNNNNNHNIPIIKNNDQDSSSDDDDDLGLLSKMQAPPQ